MDNFISVVKKFWKFLLKDTWPSFLLTLVFALIFIKFIFFPALSFITGTSLPLVIVESCSMYHHEYGFEKIFESSVYRTHGLKLENTSNWDFQNGLKKGDVIFVVRPKNIGVGDVIIFHGGKSYPLIHRTIYSNNTYSTKGDNYITNPSQTDFEKKIRKDKVIGKALFRIPFIGWAKLIFFEGNRHSKDRGLCN
tara:strand:- start:2005 stop:2586 length:582 start_codon:yes stop_codon:yes gene_type:complete